MTFWALISKDPADRHKREGKIYAYLGLMFRVEAKLVCQHAETDSVSKRLPIWRMRSFGLRGPGHSRKSHSPKQHYEQIPSISDGAAIRILEKGANLNFQQPYISRINMPACDIRDWAFSPKTSILAATT